MRAHHLHLALSTGPRRVTLTLPSGEGPFPGVVVIHDLLGFRPDTERHCRRFAEAGYAAIAPDLYGGGSPGCVVRTLLSMRSGAGEALRVLRATRQLLASRDEVDADRIGITGFCMGGGFALLAAADDTYGVAAPFYGAVPGDAERLRGICPTLAQYGENDRAFVRHGQRLARHLEELGVEHEVLFHPGVGHSFMNDHDDPLFRLSGRLPPMYAAYDEATEAEAWRRLLDFFERHL